MVDAFLRVKLKAVVGSFELAVDFAAPLSSIVLFGPSGSGKSTVLDCIAGLRSPYEGTIAVGEVKFFDSEASINLPPQKRKIGYVFQKPALFPHLSVRNNIAFGIKDWPAQKRKEREEYLLNLLHLDGLSERRPANLSGGESQRVALARAIAPEPQLLLLDEPFSALDHNLRTELGAELRSLQRTLALPMVLVTHSQQEALELADVTVCLNAGRVEKIGTPTQVLLNLAPIEIREDAEFSW
jgi:molybdate transport system ATP-binding protein